MLGLTVVLLGALMGCSCDTYLDAYAESQGAPAKSDREFSEPYPYPPSAESYPYPPSQPGPQYGPPKTTYNYGPPPVYGPPAPIYGMPHGMLSLFDKFKLKLDLFTVGKILLKIVIFKKFVSFVAILCLLLFIPSLKRKVDEGLPEGGDDDEGDDEAMRKSKAGDQFLNNITSFVLGAIDNFSKNYTKDGACEDMYCEARRMIEGIDGKLAMLYTREMQ